MTDDLGFYPIFVNMGLLDAVKANGNSILLLGLIFNIIIILFVFVAVLLIYSLLMITVETKTFENAVMRLVGLSKNGFILMIFCQSVLFVIPAIVMAFLVSFPLIALMYMFLFTKSMGFDPDPIPDKIAIA